MIFVLVYLRALEKKPVLCKSGGAYRFSRFLFPSQERNGRKSFYCCGKYLARETFHTTAWTSAICYCRNKRGYPEVAQVAQVANHSTGFGSFCRLPSLPYNKLSYRTFCSFATVNYMILHQYLLTDYITHTCALSQKVSDNRKFTLLCNLLN